MFGRRIALGGVLLGALVAAGVLFGQQPPGSKAKGRLPTYWSKLGLSEEQKKKVFAIQADYKDKIDALKKDISKLEDEERKELSKILTDPQREELKKLIATKALVEPSPDEKPKGQKPGAK
jgi:hypothetical protein